nr:zinc finger, CCHC-type, retrotransposon Gag domain protein [Tanacetum cinerariifolium]
MQDSIRITHVYRDLPLQFNDKIHAINALPLDIFLRLAGFLRAAAGTKDEQAKNFQWGLRKSTLNHLMCMPFTDVAQVANAARNYEILYERDDDNAERPDKRPGVPLRATPTRSTLRVDADT